MLIVQDALDWIGKSLYQFYKYQDSGGAGTLRVGQAWFNLLEPKDQELLRGTGYDPFYSNAWGDVVGALEYILGCEG